MQDHNTEQDLKERLTIVETMIAEGRVCTERWGWTFVVWGVAFYSALAWSAWGHNAWAWPVSMAVAAVVTFVVAFSRVGDHPKTTLGRSIGFIWIALGISMFLLFPALGFTGRLTDQHVFVAVVSAILGMANGTSGLILRWKAQLACAVVWWAAAVAACFGTDAQSLVVFLAAIFLGQIVFGAYAMTAEARQRKRRA